MSSFDDERLGLMPQGRIPRRPPGHHEWVSRDSKEIDCRALGCVFNVGAKCAVPSRCKINDKGGCDGFQAKAMPQKPDGD